MLGADFPNRQILNRGGRLNAVKMQSQRGAIEPQFAEDFLIKSNTPATLKTGLNPRLPVEHFEHFSVLKKSSKKPYFFDPSITVVRELEHFVTVARM